MAIVFSEDVLSLTLGSESEGGTGLSHPGRAHRLSRKSQEAMNVS